MVFAQQDTHPNGSQQQLQDLADKVHIARAQPEAVPLSPAEAIKALDEHSERMTAFLQRYEKGEYASLGLSPQHLSGKPAVKDEFLTS